jgi:hypothetical protein
LKSAAELVRLDTVEMDEDDEILPDFSAEVDGRRVWVTAVLPPSFESATWRARKPPGVAAKLPARFECKKTAQRRKPDRRG